MAHTQSAARQRLDPRDDDVLSWIAAHKNELPTPLYLYSASRSNDAVASCRTLFPQGARGFYSLKANPRPGLVRHVASLGIGAEVVSRGEWRLAALAGVPPAPDAARPGLDETFIAPRTPTEETLAGIADAARGGQFAAGQL